MEATLNLAQFAVATPPASPVIARSDTTRITQIEASDRSSTLPNDKPFIAQVVNARLAGSDFPDIAAEIAPPERTLRPYDVPMLPFDKQEGPLQGTAEVQSPPDAAPDPRR